MVVPPQEMRGVIMDATSDVTSETNDENLRLKEENMKLRRLIKNSSNSYKKLTCLQIDIIKEVVKLKIFRQFKYINAHI